MGRSIAAPLRGIAIRSAVQERTGPFLFQGKLKDPPLRRFGFLGRRPGRERLGLFNELGKALRVTHGHIR
jgi:hypothetical protein